MRQPSTHPGPTTGPEAPVLPPPGADVLLPRHDNLFLLARYRLDLEGERFPVSWPQVDVSSGRLTFGLAARDAARMVEVVGRSARLIDREGKVLLRLRVVAMDPRLGLLFATQAAAGA